MSSPLNRKRKHPSIQDSSRGSKSIPNHDDKINTFVFMKCNVTNTTQSRLLELAMMAVNKEDITVQEHQRSGVGDDIPRYKDTLVLAFDPPMIPTTLAIGNTTRELGGYGKKTFDENAVNAIKSFLQKQNRPICLVAHNCVDFKFLKIEINSLNMTIWDFDNDEMLYVDVIPILHALDPSLKETVTFDESPSKPGSPQQGSDDAPPIQEFENIYQRVFKRRATLDSAKNFATCLFEIFKRGYSSIRRDLRYQLFSEYPFVEPTITPQQNQLVSAPSGISARPIPDETQTYVFLDLETNELEKTVNGIAELCMIAVNTRHLNTIEKASQNVQNINPKIMEECSLMVHPKLKFSCSATKINGLTRKGFHARHIRTFNDGAAEIMKFFLERQQKPICIVAHNGHDFDFPILRRHLKNFGITDQIWNNIYCADTLIGLRRVSSDRTSYKLCNVYNDIVGQHVPLVRAALHTAEGDVLRLIAITRLVQGLQQWLDRNKMVFMST